MVGNIGHPCRFYRGFHSLYTVLDRLTVCQCLTRLNAIACINGRYLTFERHETMSQQLHTINRREVISQAMTLSLAALAPSGWAQGSVFPSKPVRIIVPFQAGGGTDILARIIGEQLSKRWGQPVLIDNRAGAGGIIGTDAVAKSAPDGYTLVISIMVTLMTAQFLYEKLPYQPSRDLALVSELAGGPLVLVTHPGTAVNTGLELLRYISANKNKVSYGSWGVGSYPHMAGAYMDNKLQAGMSHIAYKGETPMLQDLIGRQIQFAFASTMSTRQHIESGKLKLLGVTGLKRVSMFPQMPTLAEQGMSDDVYTTTGWVGMAAPAGTPKDILQRIAADVKAVTELPDVAARLISMGFVPSADTPESFAANYKRTLPIWERMVKISGAKLD